MRTRFLAALVLLGLPGVCSAEGKKLMPITKEPGDWRAIEAETKKKIDGLRGLLENAKKSDPRAADALACLDVAAVAVDGIAAKVSADKEKANETLKNGGKLGYDPYEL